MGNLADNGDKVQKRGLMNLRGRILGMTTESRTFSEKTIPRLAVALRHAFVSG